MSDTNAAIDGARGFRHRVSGAGFWTQRRVVSRHKGRCALNGRILLANSNQWYFNKLVKIPCHKTPYRCPHRLNLSSQSSRSCAGPNIKMLKDKDLEFANSIPPILDTSFFIIAVCKYPYINQLQ